MKLQNHYTTPEQSRRLLELGLPADSADCFTANPMECLSPIDDLTIFVIDRDETYMQRIDKICKNEYGNVKHSDYLPCWSVGRLIEIELMCREKRAGQIARLYFTAEDNPIDADTIGQSNITEPLIRYMESALYNYNFSKLEE